MNLKYWCITIFVLQPAMKKLQTEELYDRSSENNILKGLATIGRYVDELDETLVGYVLQKSRKKHELEASCRNATVKTFFQEIGGKSNLRVIIRNSTKNLSFCFSEEQDQSVPKGINEICLHKQSIGDHLNNSAANKFFGNDLDGDIIKCSVNVVHSLMTTQSASTIIVSTSAQNAYRFNVNTTAMNSTITSGGWFAGGVAVGFLTSALIVLLVWIYNSYTQRKREKTKDKKTKRKMSTVYADIDEYEMMPVYRDREAHCRLTPPNNADHGVSTLNKEQPIEYTPDQYFRIEDDKKTENKSYCHSKCNEQSSYSSSCKDQSSAIGITVSEQTGTYFVLQKNKDDTDNHETRNPNRDSIENKNNIRTDTTTNGFVPPTKYAKDCPHSNDLLNTTSNDMDTRIKNVRDDPSKDSAEIPNSDYDDNLFDDNTMNKQNSSGSGSIEINRIVDVIDTETDSMHNEYHTLLISETVYQQEDDVTAIYM